MSLNQAFISDFSGVVIGFLFNLENFTEKCKKKKKKKKNWGP